MSVPQKGFTPASNWFWWAFGIVIMIVCSIIFLLASLIANLNFKKVSNPISTRATDSIASLSVYSTQTKINPTASLIPTRINTETPLPTATLQPTVDTANAQYATISNEIFRVNMRKSPGYKNKNDNVDVIVEVPSGARVRILGSFEVVDGIKWWNVEWSNYEGWIAEKTGSGKTILVFDN